MFSRRIDLPLDKDPLSPFPPSPIAFTGYLAALAQAGLFGLDGLAQRWDTGMAATLTVQIPADPDGNEATSARRLQTAMNLISNTSGVTSTSVISEDKVLKDRKSTRLNSSHSSVSRMASSAGKNKKKDVDEAR